MRRFLNSQQQLSQLSLQHWQYSHADHYSDIIHCSATRSNQRFTADMLRACHNARFHGKGVGYHYYIERDGQLYQTRSEDEIGMHARHYNAHSIGICYEGGLDEKGNPADTRTPQQKAALYELLKSLHRDYPQARIIGHRELPHVAKDCPCFIPSTEYADLQPAQ